MIIAGAGAVVSAQIDGEALARQVALHLQRAGLPALPADRAGDGEPLEQALDRQVDQYRDLLREGLAETALKLLRRLLDELPAGASAKIRFRIKANIGHCYIQKADFAEAQRWLLEGYELAPAEKNAAANRALALLLAERFEDAVQVCKEALESNPESEFAATYLLQAAIHIPAIEDPISLVPEGLRTHEEVMLGYVFFLRGRERIPDWWTSAREAARRHPDNNKIALFASESYVEEAIRSPDFQRERKLSPALAATLAGAASTLSEHWEKVAKSETPDRPDGLGALVNSMVAHQALGDFARALDLAREVVRRTTDESSLTNAFQVAQFSGENELARSALDAVAEPSDRVKFFRGLLHLERNEWRQAAECLAGADVPETEKTLAATVIGLAPLRESKSAADDSEFRRLIVGAADDARSLVTIARIARFRGFVPVAEEAQKAALALVGAGATLMARGMVGAYFADFGDASATIEVLDGHVATDRPSRELQWLADAHASERPSRQRNLAFFKSLAPDVGARAEYARAHGSLLLDMGDAKAAERHLRIAANAAPEDTFAVLRLVEALRNLGRDGDADAFVKAVREDRLAGPARNMMAFAHQLLVAAEPERARKLGYRLVREHPDDSRIAMGYVGLVFEDRTHSIIPDVAAVSQDVWVAVTSSSGDHNAFVVDTGGQFLGIDALPPGHEFVRRLSGLKVGETAQFEKPFGAVETWTVAEIKSKYLHLFHVLLNEFERRFPNQGGMWRFSIKQNDITPVLDVIRKKGEADQEVARTYTTKAVPLAFVAHMMGGRPAGFADFLRNIGLEVYTCHGGLEERDAAIALAVASRGEGVALDEFTAWVAAEMGILDLLKAWFARVLVPRSTIEEIDGLIEKQRSNLGRQGMTVSWHDGQYIRQDLTDDLLNEQIRGLEKLKSAIEDNCEVKAVVLPDRMPDFASNVLKLMDEHALDPVYLSLAERVPLLSDDMKYRNVAAVVGASEGLWLQAALIAALRGGVAERTRVYRAFVQLAARKHRHVTLDPAALRGIFDLSGAGLAEFKAAVEYIGSQDADMVAHIQVTAALLHDLWAQGNADLRTQAATGCIIEKLLRLRTGDWAHWLALLIALIRGNRELLRYVGAWMTGHFMPVAPVNAAFRRWTTPVEQTQPAQAGRKAGRQSRRGRRRR